MSDETKYKESQCKESKYKELKYNEPKYNEPEQELNDILRKITPVSQEAYDACMARFDQVAKPIGSMGELERLSAGISAACGKVSVGPLKKCILVFFADNGVTVQGVTESGAEVTAALAGMAVEKRTCVCIMAKAAGADVYPIDIGMRDTVPGMTDCKLLPGTADISRGPAMSRDTALRAILTGVSLTEKMKAQGYSLIGTGETGMGNTTTSAAMVSVLMDRRPEEAAGRGAGLSDEGLLKKKAVIQKAIDRNRPDAKDPVDVLSKVGGLDIAAMTGVCLGGALYHVPVVLDGLISSAAALCAVRLHASVRDYLIPSHLSEEPAHGLILKELSLNPILHAGMRLGEGTGAAALFPLLDMAADVYRDAATYADLAAEVKK